MSRKLLITIHLYLSAFFAPAVLLVSISGGLYLVGIKGEVEQQSIYVGEPNIIDSSSQTLKKDVSNLLKQAGVGEFAFEYVKVKGSTLYTRPTSKDHYILKLGSDGVEVISAQPSLQKKMIELHMGHGPSAFKTFQKLFAVGLVFVIVSGLWLGMSSAPLRRTTSITLAVGLIVFGILLV